jgi:hypothetical protein
MYLQYLIWILFFKFRTQYDPKSYTIRKFISTKEIHPQMASNAPAQIGKILEAHYDLKNVTIINFLKYVLRCINQIWIVNLFVGIIKFLNCFKKL